MNRPQRIKIDGFTLVELLVAAAIGAALITAAVIGFGVVSQLPLKQGAVNVALPSGVIANLYGTNLPYLTLGSQPNYFQAAQARRMRERLLADVASASAVFCLGRNVAGSPAARLSMLPIGDVDFRVAPTPTGFRNLLVSQSPGLDTIFPTNQADALLDTTNASIFVVDGLESLRQSTNSLRFVAIYETDFVPTQDPAGGTFASVRRYSGTNLAVPTDFYHVYYPGEANGTNGFRPLSVFFRRAAADQPDGNDPFAVATNNPFSFIWWPDPLVSELSGTAVPSGTTNAREHYSNMAGRTSLFTVLPTFPPL